MGASCRGAAPGWNSRETGTLERPGAEVCQGPTAGGAVTVGASARTAERMNGSKEDRC